MPTMPCGCLLLLFRSDVFAVIRANVVRECGRVDTCLCGCVYVLRVEGKEE